jgi:hypothetical protein
MKTRTEQLADAKEGTMKKIINGKRYDTDKATLIGSRTESNPTDFRWIDESLYVTPRSRQYFLAGEGGAMTQYSVPVDNNARGGGSKIIPLTQAQALEWAETYLDADDVEEHFSDLIEDA